MILEGISISVAEDFATSYKPILEGLKAFNRTVLGAFENSQLVVEAKDAAGTTIGGGFGGVGLGWLKVEVLWVEEAQRGRGLGTAILAEMEREASVLGATRVMLDTIQFQAPEFYRKLGFKEFGRVKDFAQGHDRIFLEKAIG